MELLIGLLIIYLVYKFLSKLFSNKASSKKSVAISRYEVSNPNSYRHNDFYGKPNRKLAVWYECGKSVTIKGFEIPGGLIYVGEALPDSYGYNNDACLINPKLQVASAESNKAQAELGYWPQYGQITPESRRSYLRWLAGGRSDPDVDIGYVFLFFYGLERRLFIDGQKGEVSEKERLEIVDEVMRLLKIYGDNRSFKGYASNFLAMEWILYRSEKLPRDYINFNDRYCYEPFQVLLAQYVSEAEPIPADIALQWIILHPEFGLRTPARRCAREFRELFIRRYTENFGDGFIVKPNKTLLRLEYRAASPSIRGGLKLKVPDLPNPFFLKAPLKSVSTVVEECTVALEPYSRYLGRKDNGPKSLAALALLPRELMNKAPDAGKVKAALAQTCAKGPGIISIDSLFECIDEKVPFQIGKSQLESISLLVEGLGFGMAPDMRSHNIKPNADGRIVIFPNGHGLDFKPSREFRVLSTILRLGSIVSQIDQDFSPAEESLLRSLIDNNQELSDTEKDSLLAFLYWCVREPQGTNGLKQRLTELNVAEKTAISRILISVAHADGRIDPREVKQLEKLYITLGLDKEQVANDIHALAATNGPVTVGHRDKETTFSIPKPPLAPAVTGGFQLDQELIRIREEETRQVRGVLESIFVDQDEEIADANQIPSLATSTSSPLASLDEAHQNLFHRLQAQEIWDRPTLYEVCKELGLMVDGAMEVLNEWAFDNANAPLIEDGEPVYIDIDLAKEIINA